MIDIKSYAFIYVNGSLERVQRLAGKTNTKRECKENLKKVFKELNPLAKKYPQNVYYVEVKHLETMQKL